RRPVAGYLERRRRFRMLASRKIVAFVATTDFEKARAFYQGVLGLRVAKEDGHAVVLDANGIQVRVSKAPGFTPAKHTVLGWEVPDIAAEVTELAARGVAFERFGFFEQDALGIWTAPTGDKVAW